MQHRTVAQLIDQMLAGNLQAFDALPSEERRFIETVLQEMRREGRSRTLDALWEQDFELKPVSIDRFLDDDYYLGKVGSGVFPTWRTELRRVNDPKNEVGEWIIRGAIGTGKTTVAVITLLYRIHFLCCLKNPQRYYGLVEGSPLVFGLFNIFKYLAQDTSYKYFVNWVKLSPFFQESMKKAYYNERQVPGWLQRLNRMYGLNSEDLASSYMQFPKSITIALGSQAIHALGQNLYGGLMDEADMGRVKSISDIEKSQVAALYGQARSRMDSRFMQAGGSNPGILVLVSQITDKESFLEQHVAKVQNDPHTHVSAYPIWEIKSHLFPPNEPRFRVVVGNRRIRSYIIEYDAEGNPTKPIPDDVEVIDVPESLRPRFDYSVDDAIRDQAGIPTFGQDLFLPRRDKLYECFEHSTQRVHPFRADEIELSLDDESSLIDFFVKEACMWQYDKATGEWAPRWFAGIERAIHVDLAQVKDRAGLAMGCIGDVKSVERYDQDGRPYVTTDLTVFIDLAIRIAAAKGSEIDFSKIRAFIFYLHRLGYPIRYVSYDGWQSVDSRQQMIKAGYDVKELSVDKKPAPYNVLKSTIMEVRLDFYPYEPFVQEVTQLRDYTHLKTVKPAIDHPPKGRKDVSDAVCGVATRLMEVREALRPALSAREIEKRVSFHTARQKDFKEALQDPSWFVKMPTRENELEKLFKKR